MKRGEVDIAYSIRGELAEELQRTPGLTLKPVVPQAPIWLYFPEQWDPKSPWHDVRVRQAANLAIDRKGMNEALSLGYCKITNSIVPDTFEYYWQPPPPVYDPAKAKKLLAEAGYPNGFDAGAVLLRRSYANIGEVGGRQSRGRSASAPSCGRSSAAGVLARAMPTRSSHGHHPRRRAAPSATPRPGSSRSSSRAAPMSTAAIPTSTSSTRSRRSSSTEASAAAILDKMQQLVHEQGDLRADLAARLSSTASGRGSASRRSG